MTNKCDWDSFVRSKERFRVYDYFQSNKLELFNFWLDSGKSWQTCQLHVERIQSQSNESRKGWIAMQGRDLKLKFGDDRGKEIIQKRREEGMWYEDDLYPTDENEPCL